MSFPITGLFETVIRVKDLSVSEQFYCDILGFEVGLRSEKKPMIFLYLPNQTGMFVLQEEKDQFPSQHFAFRINEEDVESSLESLREKGLEPDGPTYHEWMNASSIYFRDPDGHLAEFCAIHRDRS